MNDQLKYVQTDDLVRRWDMLIDKYLELAVVLRDDLQKFEKLSVELKVIKEELHSRNIEIDVDLKDNVTTNV